MNIQINMTPTVPNRFHYILCIPRVNLTISKKDIYHVFQEINIIQIKKIRFVFKERENFATVFIYFQEFLNNSNGQIAKELYAKNQEIKVIYDFPWFWKLLPYKSKKGK